MWRAFRCWMEWCPGRVVSGFRGRTICIGWRCNDCGKVKHYGPTRSI